MRIYVSANGMHMVIPFPNTLLCSKTGARLMLRILREQKPDFAVDEKTVFAAQKLMKECIRLHGHFTLVEAEAASGEKVKIVL